MTFSRKEAKSSFRKYMACWVGLRITLTKHWGTKSATKTFREFVLVSKLLTSTGRRRSSSNKIKILEMWANAQRDGHPVEYRWRPLFNAGVWLCSNAVKTQNPLKFAGVPQTNETISAASGPKFTIL